MIKDLLNKLFGRAVTDVFEIRTTATSPSGKQFDLVYREDDPLKDLGDKGIPVVRALCFFEGKLLVVNERRKGHWNLPGGKVDPGEDYIDAIIREVKEEANMRVLRHKVIGYKDSYGPEDIMRRYPFSYCVVEPIGNFEADPGGDISEIKLIEAKNYKEYFDWGEIGDRIMFRAMEMEKLK